VAWNRAIIQESLVNQVQLYWIIKLYVVYHLVILD
jgi:hypothetical protein